MNFFVYCSAMIYVVVYDDLLSSYAKYCQMRKRFNITSLIQLCLMIE